MFWGQAALHIRNELDLKHFWPRLTMIDAVRKYSGVDFDTLPDTAAATHRGSGRIGAGKGVNPGRNLKRVF